MTQVDFHFIAPDGAPIANGQVEVRLAGEAFRNVESGVVVPRILRETADAEGRLSLDLWPLESAEYTATALDPVSGRRARYSFYVPESVVPVRMQDLVMLPPPSPKKYDEASIAAIQAERLLAQDARVNAEAHAKVANDSRGFVDAAASQAGDARSAAQASADAAASDAAAAASDAAAAESARATTQEDRAVVGTLRDEVAAYAQQTSEDVAITYANRLIVNTTLSTNLIILRS